MTVRPMPGDGRERGRCQSGVARADVRGPGALLREAKKNLKLPVNSGIRFGMLLRKVLTAIVLGAITTVLIAWGLALAFDPASGKITGSVRWSAGTAVPGVPQTDWWIWIMEAPGTLMIQRAWTDGKSVGSWVFVDEMEVPTWS